MPDEEQECAAARLVKGVIGGRIQKTDGPGAPPATVDFLLHLPLRQIALEVTSTAVREVESFWKSEQGYDWAATRCEHGWSIQLDAPGRGRRGADLRDVHRRVEDLLRQLEVAGVSRFGLGAPPLPNSDTAATVEELRQLGVVAGSSVGPPGSGPPLIVIGTTGPGAWMGRDIMNIAAEREAHANAEKLATASADERHLFIWVAWSDNEGQAASMSVLGPPDVPPDTPSRRRCGVGCSLATGSVSSDNDALESSTT